MEKYQNIWRRVLGLRAEEPLGSGIRYVQNEREWLRGVTDELEARVDWAIFCAWGCKGGLREGLGDSVR
jgi:hypothetical protein